MIGILDEPWAEVHLERQFVCLGHSSYPPTYSRDVSPCPKDLCKLEHGDLPIHHRMESAVDEQNPGLEMQNHSGTVLQPLLLPPPLLLLLLLFPSPSTVVQYSYVVRGFKLINGLHSVDLLDVPSHTNFFQRIAGPFATHTFRCSRVFGALDASFSHLHPPVNHKRASRVCCQTRPRLHCTFCPGNTSIW